MVCSLPRKVLAGWPRAEAQGEAVAAGSALSLPSRSFICRTSLLFFPYSHSLCRMNGMNTCKACWWLIIWLWNLDFLFCSPPSRSVWTAQFSWEADNHLGRQQTWNSSLPRLNCYPAPRKDKLKLHGVTAGWAYSLAASSLILRICSTCSPSKPVPVTAARLTVPWILPSVQAAHN